MKVKLRKLSRAVGKLRAEKIERQKPFALARGPLYSLLAQLMLLIVTGANLAGYTSSNHNRCQAYHLHR